MKVHRKLFERNLTMGRKVKKGKKIAKKKGAKHRLRKSRTKEREDQKKR